MTDFIERVEGSGSITVQLNGGITPDYTPNSSIPLDGMLRTFNGRVEYYDGSLNQWYTWHGATLRVELLPAFEDVMWWAMEEKQKAEQLEEKMKKFSSLRLAKENFDMVKALVENDK